ncbi:AAA domain-containing protein [Magnetospirillum sp. XM-1]|uniref:AAA domain-containing protein n=1 Tax=Magnetospirillum sp. XM-1 TaxID=1663591 RepID=UPI0012E33A9A|nr:AAA domain-containing protein [Magnetospirillum sp. XM-1]
MAKALGWDDLISLNRELLSLQSNGYTRISQNRWQVTPSGRQTVIANTKKPTSRSQAVKVEKSGSKLETAAPAKTSNKIDADALATIPVQARRQQEAVTNVSATRSQGGLNVPALLSYYRACLSIEDRSDPKAGWDEAGTRFAPVRLSGPWWPTDGRPAILTVARSLLPEGFQQAMGRSTGDGTIHLGFPLDVFGQKSAGIMVRAVCSVPLRWKATQDDVVVFETVETSVTLNAGWMAYHRKHVNFQALAERIGNGVVDDDTEDGEADALQTQQFDLKELCLLLNMAFAKKRNGDLKPEATDFSLPSSVGMHNVAALFVTSGARYSAASIRDLEVLSKAPVTEHQGTALGTLLGLTPPARTDDNAVLEPIDLTYSQLAAVRSALSEPLTVITGPPGTGKSQVVTAILGSAAAHGRTVLFASRNHAALDAVEPRLAELSPDRPLMVRFSRRWGDGTSVRIADLIRAIVARPVTAQDAGAPDNLIMSLSHLDKERAAVMGRAAKIALDREAVAALCCRQLDQMRGNQILPKRRRGGQRDSARDKLFALGDCPCGIVGGGDRRLCHVIDALPLIRQR